MAGWSTVREFWLRTRRTRKGCDRQKTALCVPSRRNDVISHIQSRPPLLLTYLTAGLLLIVLSTLQEQGGLSIRRVLQMPQARTLEVVMHSPSYKRQLQHKLSNAVVPMISMYILWVNQSLLISLNHIFNKLSFLKIYLILVKELKEGIINFGKLLAQISSY